MPSPVFPNLDPAVQFPPRGDVGDYFPLTRPDPDPDTFEIGIVLGGTVSAAAYTAGVIDFLIQVLDTWTLAKNAGNAGAPRHKVRIKILSGTSGGAISSVLIGRILAYAFPPADPSHSTDLLTDNPLFDCWVNQIDIVDLLSNSDLNRDRTIQSLLCADKIDRVGEAIVGYSGPKPENRGTPVQRDYVPQHLPVVLTLTNLRGIPYSSDFRGSGRAEYYTDYADHIRFLVDTTGVSPPSAADILPFETAISATQTPNVRGWDYIIHAARGSSAFPVGLPPQVIARNLQDYRYRYTVISTGGTPQAVWLKPAWAYMTPVGQSPNAPYEFLCVDGGCFNNEPTSYVHDYLAGVLGTNPRDGDKAHRAILLVDPFADTPDCGPLNGTGILSTAGSTLGALKTGARFATADLDLFTAADVYSRFLINPVRQVSSGPPRTGGDAIATDNLWAFGGFLSRTFRAHDFFLGRRNCQQFLRKYFVLDKTNSLFDGWTPEQRSLYGADASGSLPIVPLMEGVRAEIIQPVWPKGTFDAQSIKTQVAARIEKLSSLAADDANIFTSWPLSWIRDFAIGKAKGLGTDKILSAIEDALKSADLQ